MHARIDGDKIQLLTRTGLDWSHRFSIDSQAELDAVQKALAGPPQPAQALTTHPTAWPFQ
jgi:ATP-dependent DNA ligase